MSSNVPPANPPGPPPAGPPVGPPVGPPPGSPGGPEYLESGGGGPFRPSSGPPSSGKGRRNGLIAGGVVGLLALAGAGGWAAWSFFSTGPQPAEALPDSTIAYASIDLDPSGGQKIEAMQTLRKFPAFKDKIGLDTDDDIRKRIFEEVQDAGACPDVDYGDDIEPWLGDRMAIAAVDTGEDTPAAVFVVQVSDEDKADQGLQKLKDCGGGDSGAWSIDNGWAVVGEDQDVVDQVADDAADAPLSDDDDYTKWTDAAGDPGIASFYVAPEAGDFLAANLDQLVSPLDGLEEGLTGGDDLPSCLDPDADPANCSWDDDLEFDDPSEDTVPPQVSDALKDFGGMAATIRFDDGALELEVASDTGENQKSLTDSDRGDDVLSTLPDDTVAAVGVGFADGWFDDAMKQVADALGDGTSAEDLMDQLSQESGLDLPDDAETLAGDSAALAIGGDFDPQTFMNSSDGSDVPVGLKVKGDPDEIESVLDKIRPQMGTEESILGSDSDGDMIAIGPNADYRSQLLEDGDLGDSDVFSNVVPDADDAAAVLFVNFDAGNGWLDELADDDPEAAENLEQLQGLGVSTWFDDDSSHLKLRLTTD